MRVRNVPIPTTGFAIFAESGRFGNNWIVIDTDGDVVFSGSLSGCIAWKVANE